LILSPSSFIFCFFFFFFFFALAHARLIDGDPTNCYHDYLDQLFDVDLIEEHYLVQVFSPATTYV
jgi:hypothetical protein